MIYEFKCTKNNHIFYITSSAENSVTSTVCPQCSSLSLRIWKPISTVFKGSGFYVNDNPSSKKSTV